ncbi:sorbosone dehydrogenase family protein [Paucibacter sp. TC2R-5]|uniref:PQQ-dependent sugar dehydrogenase n=1 Tax=Paucibacter sp. TC2R-5 TaxID=2893555 RepID=UPI0021E38136|nr:sorbosone dehydrogenase family protein [Paucibacter sp. TC2R-5]MCV2360596.1 sorbosone dehydrogenase family protein [Paucibacter sp. TC2R-5]
MRAAARSLAGLGLGLTCALALCACGDLAGQPLAAGSGARPLLPEPVTSWVPTVHIAPAIGWPAGAAPIAASGLQVKAFARGLEHPRNLLLLPNGDVLVAESNTPPKQDKELGPLESLKAWVMGLVMQRAGAGVPSANRITLLRDSDGDGVADVRTVLLQGLHSPFGMALIGADLYVANTDALLKFPYRAGDTEIRSAGSQVLALPAGKINHHWTKNLIVSPDGSRLYITVGSNSNVGERGMAAELGRAAIWELTLKTGVSRVFATGLRNPNGMAWATRSSGEVVLWTVVNERDELGNDLVPDYLTSVQDAAFYGWPFTYFGQHVDARVQPPAPEQVARAIVPDYALGAHTAPLGLAAAAGNSLPARFAEGMFIGQHGSWNRRPHSGYKVVFVPFAQGQAMDGPWLDVLTGFLSDTGQAFGRPVGVALDQRGALLVADDVGNVIWRVSARP